MKNGRLQSVQPIATGLVVEQAQGRRTTHTGWLVGRLVGWYSGCWCRGELRRTGGHFEPQKLGRYLAYLDNSPCLIADPQRKNVAAFELTRPFSWSEREIHIIKS